jgi:hypothetical protein
MNPPNQSPNKGRPSSEQIAKEAFCIWMDEGCPQGRSNENWQKAEERLSAQDARGATPPEGRNPTAQTQSQSI